MITLRDYLEGKAALGFGSYGTANKAEKKEVKKNEEKKVSLRLRDKKPKSLMEVIGNGI